MMWCVTNCIFCVICVGNVGFCHCNMPAVSGMLPTRQNTRLANGNIMRLHQEAEFERIQSHSVWFRV